MANNSSKKAEYQAEGTITPEAYSYALRELRMKCEEISLSLERAEQAIDSRLISGYTFYEQRIDYESARAMAGAINVYTRMKELLSSKIDYKI